MTRISKYLFFVLMALPISAHAQNFVAGMSAFNAGDYEAAMQEWRPLAESGNSNAQAGLGLLYYTGRGVPQDIEKAMNWLELAVQQGNAIAQFTLGAMYREGVGVSQDTAEAARLILLSAEQGFPQAQHILGVMYYNGEGVPQNNASALRWFRLAAEQGHAQAQRDLQAAKATIEELAAPPIGFGEYVNAEPKFSFVVPPGWEGHRLDGRGQNAGVIKLQSLSNEGWCSIVWWDLPSSLSSLPPRQVTLLFGEDLHKQWVSTIPQTTGVTPETLSRREITNQKVDVLEFIDDLNNGGRSVKWYLVTGRVGYSIDCETHNELWNKMFETHIGIMRSFDPSTG